MESRVSETLKREKELLLESNTKIFCSDCRIVFFDGETSKYMSPLFYDFKMLAFRHAWDTKHKVKIETSYLTYHKKEFEKGLQKGLEKFSALASLGILDPLRRFDNELRLDYTAFVEDLRQRLENKHNEKVNHSFEENWDQNSTCFCSECQTEYHSPREACYCCQETKHWMPWPEVTSLGV